MTTSYIWSILGDENVPMQVDSEDINQNPHLIYDIAEFDADMEKPVSSSAEEEKPF